MTLFLMVVQVILKSLTLLWGWRNIRFKEKPVLTTGYLIKVQASANSAIDYWITGGLVT